MDFEGYTAIDLHSFCTRPVSALIWNQSGTATSSEAGSVVRVKLLAILDILWSHGQTAFSKREPQINWDKHNNANASSVANTLVPPCGIHIYITQNSTALH